MPPKGISALSLKTSDLEEYQTYYSVPETLLGLEEYQTCRGLLEEAL